MNTPQKNRSNGGTGYGDTGAEGKTGNGSTDIFGKWDRRKRGPRFWRDLATDLLNQAYQLLSERDVSFLACVQQTAHRGIVPTAAQISWIRNIQKRVEDRANVS